MLILILGLIIFLGNHSIRIIADGWRTRFIAAKGKNTWRAIYSVFSLLGLVLIIYGYGASRMDPVFIWNPPLWTRHVAALLVYVAFLLLAAAGVPNNHFKAKLGHPMFAGVKLWAFAHLLANGRLGDILLFGAFLVWAVIGFSAGRRRDKKAGVSWGRGTARGTTIVVVSGTVAYGIFAFYLHRLLIGVSPF